MQQGKAITRTAVDCMFVEPLDQSRTDILLVSPTKVGDYIMVLEYGARVLIRFSSNLVVGRRYR